MSILTWLQNRALRKLIGPAQSRTKAIVHSIWRTYNLVDNAPCDDATRWRLATVTFLENNAGHDALFFFQGASPSIKDFRTACGVACNATIIEQSKCLSPALQMQVFSVVFDTVETEIASLTKL